MEGRIRPPCDDVRRLKSSTCYKSQEASIASRGLSGRLFSDDSCLLRGDVPRQFANSRVYGLPEIVLVEGGLKVGSESQSLAGLTSKKIPNLRDRVRFSASDIYPISVTCVEKSRTPDIHLWTRHGNLGQSPSKTKNSTRVVEGLGADLKGGAEKKRKLVVGSFEGGVAERKEVDTSIAKGGTDLQMLNSCSDADRQIPVSWLVGWENDPPVDVADFNLDFDGQLEAERSYRREAFPGSSDVETFGSSLRILDENFQVCEIPEPQVDQLFDSSMMNKSSASASAGLCHSTETEVGGRIMKAGLREESGLQSGDVLNHALPVSKSEPMALDGGYHLKDIKVQKCVSSFVGEAVGESQGNAKVQNVIKAVVGRNGIKVALPSPGKEPTSCSVVNLQPVCELESTRITPPKRKDLEISTPDVQAAKRPRADGVLSEVDSKHGVRSQDSKARVLGVQVMEVKGKREGHVINQGVGSSVVDYKVDGVQVKFEGDKWEVEGQNGSQEGTGLYFKGDKKGCSGDPCVPVKCGKEGITGSEVDKIDLKDGDRDMRLGVTLGDHQVPNLEAGVHARGDVGISGFTVASAKKDHEYGTGLDGEVDAGLLDEDLSSDGVQDVNLLDGGSKGGIKNCTDLTDLLDALSDASDCPEDLNEDFVDNDNNWWQEPAVEDKLPGNVVSLTESISISKTLCLDPHIDSIPCLAPNANTKTAVSEDNSAHLRATSARSPEVVGEERNVLTLTVPRAGADKSLLGPSEGGHGTSLEAPLVEIGRRSEAEILGRLPQKEQLGKIGGSLVVNTTDTSLDLTERTFKNSRPIQHDMHVPSPQIIVLDSDSDDEGVAMSQQNDASPHCRNAVKLEHHSKDSMDGEADMYANDEEEDLPLRSSITASGSFQHAQPPLGPPLADISYHGTPYSTSLPGSWDPSQGLEHFGGQIIAVNGVSSSGEPGPSTVNVSHPHTSTRAHVPHQSILQKKNSKVQQIRKQLQQEQQGRRVSAEHLKALRLSAGISSNAILHQTNDSPNAHTMPYQNGQWHGSPSMRPSLPEAINSFSSIPSHPSAAHEERTSPMSMHFSQPRTADHMQTPPTCSLHNCPNNLMPPFHERNSVANHNLSGHHQAGTSGAGKTEPVSDHSKPLGPQKTENNYELMIAKPEYDSTLSTARDQVVHALAVYNWYLQEAQRRVEEKRQEMARVALETGEPPRKVENFRVDIHAYNDMKKEGEDVNRLVIAGDVPGVEIGDMYTYRHQMAIVGVHHLPNCGIAYGYPLPEKIMTATAIVCVPKGGYADNVDDGYNVVYTGQGGRAERNQSAPFVEHQKLEKGNKALMSNFERKVPVRMIRAHANLVNASNKKILGYTYDGLYMIVGHEYSLGVGGFLVYKFKLERLAGQAPIPPCIEECTAHPWNDDQQSFQHSLAPWPLQMVDPEEDMENYKQILGVDDTDPASPSEPAN